MTSGSTGKTAAELHTQDFIDKINAAGGNFRLNAEGKIEVIPLTYTLTVEGSEAENTGAGSYEAGQQVAIDAGAKPGYQFAGWSAPAGSFADASSAQTTFTMPAENVIVTADFKKISSSTGGGTSAYRITVEESAHGTVESDRTSASRGQLVTLTVKPEENYNLSALTVTDSRGETIELNDEGSGMFTFTMPNGKVTVTAVFTETESSDDCSRDETCPLHGFSDLNPQTWYHDGIHYCLQNGLMIGTDDALFRPEGMTTRAQIVTLLWRLEGEPSAETSPFSDVMADSYYEAAVGWAAASDIVKGVSATSFAPNDPITREQFAAILYRYAQYKGYDVSSSKDSDLSGYADASALSEYAVSAMKWACGKGLVNGTDGNRLDPKGTATRAQAAAMIQRFCASESSSSADK